MACCSYNPKFPKWNIAVQVWKFSHATACHTRQMPDIVGQIQPQGQDAHEGDRANCYFRYRKEDDRLRDNWDYGTAPDGSSDVVSFLLPSDRRVWYKVKEVQAMNAKFPNEHLVATLVKMTPGEAATATGSGCRGCSGSPSPPDNNQSCFTPEPSVQTADGEQVTLTVKLLYPDLTPVVGTHVDFDIISGVASLPQIAGVTDEDGELVVPLSSETVGSVEVQAAWPGGNLVATVEFVEELPEPPEPSSCDVLTTEPVLRLTFANVSSRECTDCGDFNTSVDLQAVGMSPYSLWKLEDVPHPCFPSGVNYSITVADGLIQARVAMPDTDSLIIFEASCTDWLADTFLPQNTGQSQYWDAACWWYTGQPGETATCELAIP